MKITIILPAEPSSFTDSSTHQLPETQVAIQSHQQKYQNHKNIEYSRKTIKSANAVAIIFVIETAKCGPMSLLCYISLSFLGCEM